MRTTRGMGISPLSFPRRRDPIFQRPACVARWVPAFAGTTVRLLRRRWLSPPRAPTAAHAGAAGGRARARAIGLGFFVGAGAHLVERGVARGFAHTPHPARLRRGTLSPHAGGGGRPRAARWRSRWRWDHG